MFAQLGNGFKPNTLKGYKTSFAHIAAPTKQAAEAALNDIAQKWEAKYAYSIQSRRNNWDKLTVFFEFPIEMRTIIYTKNKMSFPTDQAVLKSVYPALKETEKVNDANS